MDEANARQWYQMAMKQRAFLLAAQLAHERCLSEDELVVPATKALARFLRLGFIDIAISFINQLDLLPKLERRAAVDSEAEAVLVSLLGALSPQRAQA